ncbi:unnamed protein product [Closterium sp. NIES-53]
MAAQELRWLTYLLTDLGEPPRSPPVLYVDNKAMLALCREQRLEHRTKHIALRYFLARELQQRGQLRLAYVASEANTADVLTKALAPCDHQRCCTQLGLLCFALLDWSCDPLFSPTLPMGTNSGVSGLIAASSQVFAAASRSSPASAPCSCRPLSHKTLLWHHRFGHPSLPRLRGMASRTLGHERYFLLVVDDYSRYTTVFPLRRKGEVTEVLIDWIRGARRQLSESFGSDLPVLRLHSHRGGEFSSDLLRAFRRAEGIRQTFTLPASPHQNGIAERLIAMVMDVARTPMILAAAPHFLWPFAVQYAAHQINLQPRVSLPETTPTLRWTGKVGDASVFRVWGSRAFVRDTSVDKLSSRADVTFDESVSYYRLFPYRTASLPPSPLFLALGAPPVDPLPPQGLAPSGVSQLDPVEPVEVAVDSGAARGAEPAGAGPGGAKPGVAKSEGAEPGGAAPQRVEPGGAESRGAEPGGAEPERAESGGPPDVPSQREPLSPQRLHECRSYGCAAGTGAAGASGPGGPGAGGTGAVGGPTGVGAAGGAGAAGPGGPRTGGSGAAGTGGAAGVGAVGARAVATGGAAEAGAAGGTGAGGDAGVVAGDPGAEGTGASPPPVQSQSRLQPASPLPGPSPYSGPTRGLTERHESRPASPESRPASPESRPESPVRTGRRRVPLPSPPASSLLDGPDPESDSLRAASPSVTRFLATAVTEALAHMKSELQKRHTCTDLGELTSYLGLRITRDRAQRTITLIQSHMVHQVLQRFGFTYSSPQSTPLPTGHSLLAPPSDESVEPSGPYPELVGCLMYVMTCKRPDLAYPLSLLARYVAPVRQAWGSCLEDGIELSSLVMQTLPGCDAEIYAGAMAAQELRWLTYLLNDLGEAPRSPLVLYVDNKAMLALCQEHRLEHKTKHIALHYFLARELQQRGQLRLAYVASQANTADVFTKALQPCDHQRFCDVLGLVPTVPHLPTS